MIQLKKVLADERRMRALTGSTPKEFNDLLPEFSKILDARRAKEYRADPNRERKPGGGRKGFLKTPEEKLFFILFYFKCYPTYDVAGFVFDADRSNCCRRRQFLDGILESTLGRKLVLPKRQIRSVKEFFEAFPEAKEVFVDGTERPIQRPKDKGKQKANYSGKKKRHTRKNLVISTRKKRIGFLSKTVDGKEHDFSILKAQAPPNRMPPDVKKHADLGFKGFDTEYPDHVVSLPQRKPRTRDLTEVQKERNRKKSRIRVLVEHAIGGVKRFRIVSDVFRNKEEGFDDQAMFVSCGLWNHHLAMR